MECGTTARCTSGATRRRNGDETSPSILACRFTWKVPTQELLQLQPSAVLACNVLYEDAMRFTFE
jgi:hypothetical protein